MYRRLTLSFPIELILFLISLRQFHYICYVRKALIYILIGFYFLISIRFTVNLHFCKDRFISASVVGFSKIKTCCKAKKMKNNCCKNIHVSLKKSNNDKPNKTIAIPIQAVAQIIEPIIFSVKSVPILVPQEIIQSTHSPPNHVFPPIYIKNCVFII